MKFFAAQDGALYPVDEIARIGLAKESTNPAHPPFHEVRLKGRDTVIKVSRYQVDCALMADNPVIEAAPGTELISFVAAGANPDHWRAYATPMVGWRVDGDRPHPITIEDFTFGASRYSAIRLPDGRITDDSGEIWTSIAAFEDSARGWALADREESDAG